MPPDEPTPINRSSVTAAQRFSTAQAKADLDREDQAFRHRETQEDRAFRHREAERDSRQRRTITNVVGAFLLAVAVVGFGVGVAADNGGTRERAQGLVTVLVGGLVGFLTGRSLK